MKPGTFLIFLIVVICVGMSLYFEYRDEKMSKSYHIDTNESKKREAARRLRYQYRDSVSKLQINYKESWESKAGRILDKLVSILYK